ncbi:MAG: ATP-binding cassette domain-containing protein [Proteobacteria bacterium]|nr:ATP-binding cassette domain-containing protein [Pseudomonadota bacterium]
MILLEAGQAAAPVLMSATVGRLVDSMRAVEGTITSANVLDVMWSPLVHFALLNLMLILCSRTSGSILVIIGPALRARTREGLFAYLQHHSHRYFMGQFAGSLANRITEVATSVNHALWTVMFDFWPVTVSFSVSMYLLFKAHTELAAVLAMWTMVYVAVSFLLARRCRVLASDFAAARSLVSGKVVDAVTNIMNIKLFSRRRYEREYLKDYLQMEVMKARKTFWFMEIMRWFQFLAAASLLVGMVMYAMRLWAAGEISMGAFVVVFGLCTTLVNDARGLSRRFLEFFEYVGNINDGVSIIIRPHEIVDVPAAPALKVPNGRVVFKDVTFAHKAGVAVFDGLNVTIEGGQKIGLVGHSGAGKSTFVNLLLRLHDLNGGAIEIDGQDIAHVRQDSLRANIAMIPQDPMLFHRTLKENIRYGREDATDEEVLEASRRAYCHDFIQDVPEGYDALVGERGVKLSGGQRQRIAIARAMVKDAPILVLDEATSSLDSESERYIQQSLDDLMKERTVLVIAHRLSTIANMDRILVFDQGRIVEDGSHEELLKRNGLYARLWNMQAGGFLPE